MRDPYDILGVKPTASEDELRRAFRRLAKQYHPDLNPGNAEAEQQFKEVNAAYDLLSDPARRARFDRGEIDAEGRETFAHAYADARGGARAQGFGGRGFQAGFHHFTSGGHGSEDMSDLFSHLFGERFGGGGGDFRMRGRDLRHAITVEFLDAANGARRRLALPDGRSLDVTIPAGIADGQTLRLKGQGEPGLGGDVAGDLLLEVHVAPHKLFRRVNNDIHLDLPVTLGEAVAGGRVTVPTIAGRVVLTIPPGSNTGSVLRLKGKGITGGDQYVTVKVVLPARPDEELADFVARWSARHPYDPRAEL